MTTTPYTRPSSLELVEVKPGHFKYVPTEPPKRSKAIDPTTKPNFPGQCLHLGAETGDTVSCPTCRGGIQLKLYQCSRYGQCTIAKWVEGVACCNGKKLLGGSVIPCPSYETSNPVTSPPALGAGKESASGGDSKSDPKSSKIFTTITEPLLPTVSLSSTESIGGTKSSDTTNTAAPEGHALSPEKRIVIASARSLKWAYGVTTVPSRRDNLLVRTLASLSEAGFEKPRLFIDGARNDEAAWWEKTYGLETTIRSPTPLRTHGNWVLALYELYIRDPNCQRYAVFQDDFITYRNLRQYLEQCQYPAKGYLNLYTMPSNQSICPKDDGDGKTELVGWYQSNQFGRGAVALVFDREAVLTLLTARHMVERPMDAQRGWRVVDGGIVDSMTKAGFKEYVHNPSLVQHIGDVSSMRSKQHPRAISFKGEGFNAMDLVPLSTSVAR